MTCRVDDADVLDGRNYFFHVPNISQPYPVYPTFRDWNFPHDNLPHDWHERSESIAAREFDNVVAVGFSTLIAAIMRRDTSCIVSGYGDSMESAHICPRSEIEWFNDNMMQQYNRNRNLSSDTCIDDVSNAFALRSDIHRIFDDA